MKKKFFLVIGVAATSALAVCGALISSDASADDVLFYSNVEALMKSESKLDSKTCYHSITTADGQWVKYCGNCDIIEGKPSWSSGKGICE